MVDQEKLTDPFTIALKVGDTYEVRDGCGQIGHKGVFLGQAQGLYKGWEGIHKGGLPILAFRLLPDDFGCYKAYAGVSKIQTHVFENNTVRMELVCDYYGDSVSDLKPSYEPPACLCWELLKPL